jgi:type I restriction enzyme S subunit
VFFIERDFWPLNTTLYVRDFKGNDERFVSYFLRSLDFQSFNDRAAFRALIAMTYTARQCSFLLSMSKGR